jgi:hypothetical protein
MKLGHPQIWSADEGFAGSTGRQKAPQGQHGRLHPPTHRLGEGRRPAFALTNIDGSQLDYRRSRFRRITIAVGLVDLATGVDARKSRIVRALPSVLTLGIRETFSA